MTRQILMYQDNIKNYHDRARQIMTNHDKIRARRFLLAPLVLRVATPGAVFCFLAGGPLLAKAGDVSRFLLADCACIAAETLQYMTLKINQDK